jgi:hypothetical protein
MEELPSELHYESNHPGPCTCCSKQTNWIDLTLETWLCPGACTDSVWEKFNAGWEASIKQAGKTKEEDDPFLAGTVEIEQKAILEN